LSDLPSPCFVAYPTGIAVVKVLFRGDGDRNLKHDIKDPYVVMDLRTKDEFVVPRAKLYATHKEAAAASAEIRRAHEQAK